MLVAHFEHNKEHLKARNSKEGERPHLESLGELAARVSHEADHRACHALIFGPSVHHCSVVDAVHDHLVDPLGLERGLRLQVTRDLLRGSGGRVRAGQADDDDLLAGKALRHVDLTKARCSKGECRRARMEVPRKNTQERG